MISSTKSFSTKERIIAVKRKCDSYPHKNDMKKIYTLKNSVLKLHLENVYVPAYANVFM